jgi:hypothetical protein
MCHAEYDPSEFQDDVSHVSDELNELNSFTIIDQ